MSKELESLGEWETWQQRSDYSEHWFEPQFICQLIGYDFAAMLESLETWFGELSSLVERETHHARYPDSY